MQILKMGIVLTIVGAVATTVLASVYDVTKGPIAEAKRQEVLAALKEVLPPGFDNEPDRDTVVLVDKRLHRKEKPVTFYRSRISGEVTGVAYVVTAPDGYSGDIDIMMGLNTDGVLTGIKVVAHAETPGLGDKIVVTDWPESFKGESQNSVKWAVKKDGGHFDQFAGATITPRAVVNAVKRGLDFFAENKAKCLADPPAKADDKS
ncbi:electron transport complex subunit RsxG [Magnetofaba australis]|uniref:Ion-translocating oxidoreductase complex subunit G n=1 Tax=Magnetofaba australis IT-1 TaxID=1434232 RepID=A0A1Y2K428_9PROT|nr:electron transport complex subunit RsxG [Magnetofaba australis]OSM01874.1 putative RnfABCDGE type electron transport complex subunit G [Magnetofaba australis IT-1]